MTQCHLNRQPQRSVRNNRVKYSAYGKSSECSVLHHSVLIPHSAISVVATMAASKLAPRLKANNTGTGYVQAAQLHNNPVALLPPHLQKNLDLEVVVMSDILPDDTPIQIPRHPPPPQRNPFRPSLYGWKSTQPSSYFRLVFPRKGSSFPIWHLYSLRGSSIRTDGLLMIAVTVERLWPTNVSTGLCLI